MRLQPFLVINDLKKRLAQFNAKKLRDKFTIVIVGLVSLVVFSTIAFSFLEGLDLVDAFHLAVATITTIGYAPLETAYGKVLSTIIVIIGIGFIFWILPPLLETRVKESLEEELGLVKAKKEFENHVIICGYGDVGSVAVEDLNAIGTNFVVIKRTQKKLEN